MSTRRIGRRESVQAMLGGGAALAWGKAHASTYPSEPIKVVVPFAAGGTTDLMGRFYAEQLKKSFNLSVLVENRGGAGGLTGAEMVSKAPPDGYTLLVTGCPPLTTSKALFPRNNFDPAKQLAPIGTFSVSHYILVVHASLPIKSVAELVSYAKAKPGSLTYASPGIGTAGHLIGAMFSRAADIEMVHVPYQGSGQSRADLLAGNVSLMFENVAVISQVGNQVRPLATTRPTRLEWAPDVPTMAEVGFPQIKLETIVGAFGPVGLPANIVEVLNAEAVKLTKDKDFRAKLKATGTEAFSMLPAELGKLVAETQERWGEIIKGAGIRID